MTRSRLIPVAAALLLAITAAPAAARQAGAGGEAERIREAERLEAAGDMARAAALLQEVLRGAPGSVPALLGLERVLRVQGRTDRLPPLAEALVRADPASAALGYQVLVRAYDTIGDEAALHAAGDRWIEVNPRIETPYRELAAVWANRSRLDHAIAILERGRAALGSEDALSLELGNAYARSGDAPAAARAWTRAIGPETRGLRQVRRRLAELPDSGAAVMPYLVEALTGAASIAGRRAALELAIDARMERRALELGRSLAGELDAAGRDELLLEIARRADGAGLRQAAYWAYTELLGDAPDERALALRSRAAELAMELGDAAGAAEHLAALEAAPGAGVQERRRAAAQRIELEARGGDQQRAVSDLEAFRSEHPEAPELDRLAAAVAGMLLAGGDDAGAERVLAGVEGPASSVVSAWLALRRGDVRTARAGFLAAAPSLRGPDATEAMSLATLLGRLSADGGRILGAAMVSDGAGEPADAIAELDRGAGTVPSAEAAALLDFAAALADRRGLAADAERMRRRIVDGHPKSREAPAAMLALARALLQRPDSAAEARALLERLVVEHPDSALAPQARRELENLEG